MCLEYVHFLWHRIWFWIGPVFWESARDNSIEVRCAGGGGLTAKMKFAGESAWKNCGGGVIKLRLVWAESGCYEIICIKR